MENIDKKLVIFDLDNTLTESRMPIDEETSELLCRLLSLFKVAVISGTNYGEFERRVSSKINCQDKFKNLILMPNIGSEMYTWSEKGWVKEYTVSFSPAKKHAVLKELSKITGLKEDGFSKFVEDNGSEITYSALGTDALLADKAKWDPDKSKRMEIIETLKPKLPGVNMVIGGRTSINFTEAGIDKAFGISKMIKNLGMTTRDAIFIGDALEPGGNDESVKSLGISVMFTTGPNETNRLIERLIGARS